LTAPRPCRSPINFLRWQEWSVQFEQCRAVPAKSRRPINNATEPSFVGDNYDVFGNVHVLTQALPRNADRYVGVRLLYGF